MSVNLDGLEESLKASIKDEAASKIKAQEPPPSHANPFGEVDAGGGARSIEDEINRRKKSVRDNLLRQQERVSAETRKLAKLQAELDKLEEPVRREVAMVRSKIEGLDRQLAPRRRMMERKKAEYEAATAAFEAVQKEKEELSVALAAVVSESERLRLDKLEELNRTIEEIHGPGAVA